MTITYAEWSKEWKAAKKRTADIERVIELWGLHPPRECLRDSWPEKHRAPRRSDLGFRKEGKRAKPAGEQVVEKALLGETGTPKEHRIVHSDFQPLMLTTYLHNMALSNSGAGQVITDAFGILRIREETHPVAIEVKVTADDCWAAVVQCLQQVRMMRHNKKRLQTFCTTTLGLPDAKGAWGMVVAPKSYFTKKEASRRSAIELLSRLVLADTEARIMLAESGDTGTEWLDAGALRYVDGHWPAGSAKLRPAALIQG